jgi:glyoxylase-like metal-dependent hydrolase (beta-lactamase superfamily II)
MSPRFPIALCALIALFAPTAATPQDELPPAVEVTHLTGNLHQLRCNGQADVVASVGADGILLVDTGYGQTAEALDEAVAAFGGGPVRIIVNTHGDGDHVGGNALLGRDAVIIARPEVRQQMGTFYALPISHTAGLPTVTIDGETTIFFNGEVIRVFSAAGAHTAGDSVVHFTRSGLVHVGDLVLLGRYPNAAPARGGNARRLIEVLESLTTMLPEDITFLASHGGTFSMQELREYLDMTRGTASAVQEQMAEGLSLAQIIDNEPLKAWERWADPEDDLSSANWITEIYGGLSGTSVQSICQPVTEALVENGAEAAAERYRELKRTEPENWSFAEYELNGLGYQLLARERIDDAIIIFELNAEAFPEAFNPYDSLGEAYMLAGNTELAITNYEKSLELNPDNANATAMLARLEN